MKNYFGAIKIILICFVFFSFASVTTFAQCKRFIKDQIPRLSPFVYSGRINSAVLLPGDHSELSLTFYSGRTYRIILKSQETIGDVFFVIRDANRKQLFSSDKLNRSDFYDFISESTQQLTIEMMVPERDSKSEVALSECVCVIVGEKE